MNILSISKTAISNFNSRFLVLEHSGRVSTINSYEFGDTINDFSSYCRKEGLDKKWEICLDTMLDTELLSLKQLRHLLVLLLIVRSGLSK